MNSLRAKLLVATPLLPDPNFHRTVILLIEHNEEGALGIVLNRPRLVGGAEADSALEGWDLAASVIDDGLAGRKLEELTDH